MHFTKVFSLLLLTVLSVTNISYAQDIRAGIITGVNLSQVDGDNIAGFYKIGLNVGGAGIWQFNEKFSGAFEIIYSQKGSSSSPTGNPGVQKLKFKFDYVDVPVIFRYHDRAVSFGAGFTIGSLVSQYVEVAGLGLQSTLSKRDFNILAEGNYMINEKLALNIRYSISLLGIGVYNGRNLTNRFISIRLMYILQRSKK